MLQGYNASPVGGIGRHDQPSGAAEGLRQASAELRSGFGSAAQAVVVRPARTLQQDGVAAAFGGACTLQPASRMPPASSCLTGSSFRAVGMTRGSRARCLGTS